jgi:Cft2 family RNA processing exonuclease
MPPLTIRHESAGLHLPRLGLWLDARRRQPAGSPVFISHAHSDHIAAHAEVIVSAPTARLLRTRLRGERQERVLAFGERAVFRSEGLDYGLTLLPAGHILGSAMAWIEAGGQSLLYTGDFKLRPGLAAEPCAPRHADVLVMETTFGRPKYRFPPCRETWAEIVAFCRQTLEDRATPVLMGYPLGKTQELLYGLGQAGLPVMVHPSAHEITQVYAAFDPKLPSCEVFDRETARGKVLIFPPRRALGDTLKGVGTIRTAVCTGWAIDPGCAYRYGVDAAFVLSDHADYDDLLEFVDRVGPRKVLTVHGFAADFAQTLRDLGYDAHALSEPDQLHLDLFSATRSHSGPRRIRAS